MWGYVGLCTRLLTANIAKKKTKHIMILLVFAILPFAGTFTFAATTRPNLLCQGEAPAAIGYYYGLPATNERGLVVVICIATLRCLRCA